jgi:hypothetical protein
MNLSGCRCALPVFYEAYGCGDKERGYLMAYEGWDGNDV